MATLRPSSLVKYADCETYGAVHRAVSQARHIAAWVGDCVHAIIADQDPPWNAPDTEPFRYDIVTPAKDVGIRQIKALAREVHDAFADRHWQVVAAEVPIAYPVGTHGSLMLKGTADLIVQTGRDRYHVLDLKTGRIGLGEWLQVGAYAAGVELQLDPHGRTIVRPDGVGIVHAQRVRESEPVTVTIETREYDFVVEDSLETVQRIADVARGEVKPSRTPGRHCAYCPIKECGIRALAVQGVNMKESPNSQSRIDAREPCEFVHDPMPELWVLERIEELTTETLKEQLARTEKEWRLLEAFKAHVNSMLGDQLSAPALVDNADRTGRRMHDRIAEQSVVLSFYRQMMKDELHQRRLDGPRMEVAPQTETDGVAAREQNMAAINGEPLPFVALNQDADPKQRGYLGGVRLVRVTVIRVPESPPIGLHYQADVELITNNGQMVLKLKQPFEKKQRLLDVLQDVFRECNLVIHTPRRAES